jgi:hypothetical protein
MGFSIINIINPAFLGYPHELPGNWWVDSLMWFQVLLTWASTREPRRRWGRWFHVAPLYPKGVEKTWIC